MQCFPADDGLAIRLVIHCAEHDDGTSGLEFYLPVAPLEISQLARPLRARHKNGESPATRFLQEHRLPVATTGTTAVPPAAIDVGRVGTYI